MTRSAVISAALHLLIIVVFLIGGGNAPVENKLAETVRIRVSMAGRTPAAARTAAGDPSVMNRTRRPHAGVPDSASEVDVPDFTPRPGSVSSVPVDSVDTIPPTQPAGMALVDPMMEKFDILDPMAGMETAFPGEASPNATGEEKWSVSWLDGSARGISHFPEIDPEELSGAVERLKNVAIEITVSSAGEVIAAEVPDPGSGDTRIDRYLVQKALELVLDPAVGDMESQDGILKLVFYEEGM